MSHMARMRILKVVGVSVVKNEEWIIEEQLESMSALVDEIVIVDDGSSDRTVEIIRRFPKVVELRLLRDRRQKDISNFNLALRLAQRRGADWILRLDADEIFEERMKERIRDLVEGATGDIGEFTFRKLWLWRSREFYRADRPEKFQPIHRNCLFRNVPGLRWVSETGDPWKRVVKRFLGLESWIHQAHAQLMGVRGRAIFVEDVILLHHAAVDYGRLVKKQLSRVWLFKKSFPATPVEAIVERLYTILDEEGLRLLPVNPEWFAAKYLGVTGVEERTVSPPRGEKT